MDAQPPMPIGPQEHAELTGILQRLRHMIGLTQKGKPGIRQLRRELIESCDRIERELASRPRVVSPAERLAANLAEIAGRMVREADDGIAKPCATEGCGEPAVTYFERGSVGSYFCAACAAKVAA